MRRRSWVMPTLLAVIGLGAAFVAGDLLGASRGLPFLRTSWAWSAGIYEGPTPFQLAPAAGAHNPVLTGKDVTDRRAEYVADTFMVQEGGRWYMFFEAMINDADTYRGQIGLATSDDARHWHYRQIVLDEPFHVSFPYVFKWENDYYMVPESVRSATLRLYRAVEFPTRWTLAAVMMNGIFHDPAIFRWGERWWLLAEASPHEKNDTLRLYYADQLAGPWTEHPMSPVVKGNEVIARPAGRVITWQGRLYRFAQSNKPHYGSDVRAFEITELTPTSFKEVAVPNNPILKGSGSGWNGCGMHTVDLHQLGPDKWIAAVDGCEQTRSFDWHRF
jgi:hypothetical protein